MLSEQKQFYNMMCAEKLLFFCKIKHLQNAIPFVLFNSICLHLRIILHAESRDPDINKWLAVSESFALCLKKNWLIRLIYSRIVDMCNQHGQPNYVLSIYTL